MTDSITFARALRKEQTLAERAFWALLYPWREAGMHWRRQAPIGPYVVDFVCKREKLVVEIDADSHYFDEAIAATRRARRFSERGVCFSNDDVLGNAEGVFEVLRGILGDL